jgi:MFS family permease
MAFELIGYFLFGVGYIVYFTFLVAWMREIGAGPALVTATWGLLGLGIMLSPLPWARVLARFKGGQPLALADAATGFGTLLPILAPGPIGILASAAVFGLSIFIGPAAVTAFGRANLEAALWGRSVALFTSVFALGQIFGPIAAGLIADAAHNLGLGLGAAAFTLFAAAGAAAAQRPLTNAA